MKNILTLFILACAVLITGCSQDKETSAEKETELKVSEQAEESEGSITVENSEADEKQVVEDEEDIVEEKEKEISPTYQLQENWNLAPINEIDNEKVVLLTIDDAPDKHALEMAKTLKELDANAIFFVNGHFLDTEEEKATLKEIYDMGFEIGNHTYNHQALPDVDEATQKEEIVALSDLVEEITGERPKFFRAPHGMNTDFSRQLVKDENMLLMNWTFGYDWEKDYMTPEAIADIMVNTELLTNGSNLLMHDREWTAEGLSEIVEGLRKKGFEVLDPDTIEINVE